MTNEELDRLVAEKVAGWLYLEAAHKFDDGTVCRIDAWCDPSGRFGDLPRYSTDASAALPLLQRHDDWDARRRNSSRIRVTVYRPSEEFEGEDESFARAACLALLKSHGVEVGP